MNLTVSEQSTIRIGSNSSDASPALGRAQATALVDCGGQIGARFATWQGPTSMRIEQFVGQIRVGDLQLEILPKLDGLNSPGEVRKNLLAMLAVTEDLEVRPSELVSLLESSEPFICALARLYCSRLLDAVRRGLRQNYVVHENLLPYIRGRVDWTAQSLTQVTQRLEFNCIFDERSVDTFLNRALKAALGAALRILDAAGDRRVLTELQHALSDVSDIPPSPAQLQRLQTDRIDRGFGPLLTLAKLLLRNHNPDVSRSAQGARSTYALIWDMNVLFEEYVGRIAARTFSAKGVDVDLQCSTHLAREATTRRYSFLLTPDILIRQVARPLTVADTKWKRLAAKDANLGVLSSDVYQVLAYAHRYHIKHAVLVYPHHPALGMPGTVREFLTQGIDGSAVLVRILTVDLARLDTVPLQLEQCLLAGERGPQQGLLSGSRPAIRG